MSPFTAATMRQLDAIAERRVYDDAFHVNHPECAEVRMTAEDHARNARCRAFAKSKERRFSGDPVTAFGEFA